MWQPAPDPLEAVRGADAVLLLTEWAEFRTLDWPQLAVVMRPPAWLFDARTVADAAAARSAGLRVWVVGVGMRRAGRCQWVGFENRPLVLRAVSERPGSDRLALAAWCR